MNKFLTLTLVLCLCACFVFTGCASIIHPSRTDRPKEARGKTDWVAVAGNVLIFGGILGLIIDISNGAIYKTKQGYRDQYGRLIPKPEPQVMGGN